MQGRLDRDEFDLRVGRALASRTCGELAALTADLPSGLVTVPRPGKAARARTRSPVSKVVVGAAMTIPAPATVMALLHTGSESAANVIFYVLLIYLMAWSMAFVTVVHTIAESHGNRSRRKLPPRRTQRGQALEGEQETGTGVDLMLSEARRGCPRPSPTWTRSYPAQLAVIAVRRGQLLTLCRQQLWMHGDDRGRQSALTRRLTCPAGTVVDLRGRGIRMKRRAARDERIGRQNHAFWEPPWEPSAQHAGFRWPGSVGVDGDCLGGTGCRGCQAGGGVATAVLACCPGYLR